MFRPSHAVWRGIVLAAAVALPLLSGAAVAQILSDGAVNATAAAKPADKPIGALKATPAEKKAAYDKLSAAGRSAPKTVAAKQAHLVKPSPAAAKSGSTDAAKTAAPTAE